MLTHSDCYTRQSSRVLAQAYYRYGDPCILAVLFQRYQNHVFRLCLSYLDYHKDAEDATMDIFSLLPVYLRKYEIHSFTSWIGVFCRNHCLQIKGQKLKQVRCYASLTQDLSWEDPFLDEKKHREQKLERLHQGIALLNRKQRNCILCFYYAKQSYKEIALHLNISTKEVKNHLQNGKRNLRNFFDATVI